MIRALPLVLVAACLHHPGAPKPATGPLRDEVTPLDLGRLEGPFADDAAVCANVQGRNSLAGNPRWCDELVYGNVEGPKELPASGAWRSVRLFPVHEPFAEDGNRDASWGGEDVHLALTTERGTWVGPPLVQLWNPGAFGVFAQVAVQRLEYVDLLPGGAPEVLLRYTRDTHDTNMGFLEILAAADEWLVICALDAAGVPACSAPVLLGKNEGRLPLVDLEATELRPEPYWHTAWTSTIELGEALIQVSRSTLPPEPAETDDPRFAVEERLDAQMPEGQELAPRFTDARLPWPDAE